MMGREIRKVIPNWENPKKSNGHYQPMFNRAYKKEAQEWIDGLMLWVKGEHPHQKNYPNEK